MRRREFITLLGGTAAAWPLGAQAQQPAKPVPIIGFVHARSRDDTAYLAAAFRQGLVENGYVEGKDVVIDFRFAAGQYNQLTGMVEELVQRPVAVLFTGADPAAVAGKHVTTTTPIVFVVGGDPVKLGLVASLNRPDSNATGATILTTSLEPKRLGLLHELLPQNATLAVFLNPKFPLSQKQSQEVQEAAREIGLSVRIFWVATDAEIESAMDTIDRERIAALMVGADPYFDTRRNKLTSLAIGHKLPTMFQFREYAVAGGLMSYGINLPEVYRQVGVYTARILKGEKPADLPVLQPTKFEFVVNLKTAKSLGIEIPGKLLSFVDEVIE
jgi:putative ABC transport system substrate-binding protein